MPILHIMMGNNHLNALAYESAIESYTKAVSFEKFYIFQIKLLEHKDRRTKLKLEDSDSMINLSMSFELYD